MLIHERRPPPREVGVPGMDRAEAKQVRLIITHEDSPDGTIVKIAGWLSAAGVSVLLEACEDCPRPLIIDLTNLRDADQDGLAALHRLKALDVKLVGASPYMELLIHGHGT